MLTDDDSLWWERSRTAAGLSDPTLPGLRGREEEEEEEEEEEGGAQSVHGSDFPSAPHLLQLSPYGPTPPGVRSHRRGLTGRQMASDASADSSLSLQKIAASPHTISGIMKC